MARNEVKLKELADELRVQVEVLPADLCDPEQLASVEARLADAERPVDVLVNNAGAGTKGPFAEQDRAVLDNEVALDVIAVMRLMRAAVPGMIERGSGGILNVASIAAFQGGPGNAVYSASKAFVLSLSEAVHEEVKGTGVRVTVVCPGATRTEFQQRGGFDGGQVPDFLWETPEEVADKALKALARNQAVYTSGFLNKLGAVSAHLAPRVVSRKLSARVTNHI